MQKHRLSGNCHSLSFQLEFQLLEMQVRINICFLKKQTTKGTNKASVGQMSILPFPAETLNWYFVILIAPVSLSWGSVGCFHSITAGPDFWIPCTSKQSCRASSTFSHRIFIVFFYDQISCSGDWKIPNLTSLEGTEEKLKHYKLEQLCFCFFFFYFGYISICLASVTSHYITGLHRSYTSDYRFVARKLFHNLFLAQN